MFKHILIPTDGFVLGSVTQQVLARSGIPVLAYR